MRNPFKKAPKPVSPIASLGGVILTGALLQVGMSLAEFVGETVSNALTARKERKLAEQASVPRQYAQPRANG